MPHDNQSPDKRGMPPANNSPGGGQGQGEPAGAPPAEPLPGVRSQETVSPTANRRPKRNTRPPAYLDDYVPR